MLRILLFLGTNLAVMALLGLVMAVLQGVFGVHLGNTGALLVMAAVFGMGGSFISLALSKTIAKWTTGAQVIVQPRDETQSWLLATVQRLAQKAGVGTPEVAVYDAPDMNAFATGMRRDHALVAVSTGLLRGMSRREVEAVLGHELSHVANGDMVTLTLIQGVLNTFVIFFARVIGSIIDSALRGERDERGGGFAYFIIVMVLQTVLGILASMVVAWFSRYREFRADAGSARLEGREPMISALERLRAVHEAPVLPEAVAAFGISGNVGRLFASHPPIEDRIAALQQLG
jgi:heat shock protein HtpX